MNRSPQDNEQFLSWLQERGDHEELIEFIRNEPGAQELAQRYFSYIYTNHVEETLSREQQQEWDRDGSLVIGDYCYFNSVENLFQGEFGQAVPKGEVMVWGNIGYLLSEDEVAIDDIVSAWSYVIIQGNITQTHTVLEISSLRRADGALLAFTAWRLADSSEEEMLLEEGDDDI